MMTEGKKLNIEIGCCTCRKNRQIIYQDSYEYLCNYRTVHCKNDLCEQWLPSKESLRVWIKRAEAGIGE